MEPKQFVYRYPGVKPFEAEEKALFFGRDRDIQDLCDLIRVEKLSVLFGKSGYGKSSILNAGVLPRLRGTMLPVEVRLGEYLPGQSPSPVETLLRKLAERGSPHTVLSFLQKLPVTLWTQFKQTGGAPSGGFLLVFDQFEEFFSYPAEQQRAFREQLAELLNEELPESVRELARSLDREQRRALAAPVEVRVLLAVRSDRLHELDRMKDQLPGILHKRYELRALSREQAREAIVGPAALIDPRPDLREGRITNESIKDRWAFASPAFTYQPEAIERILADLTKSNTGQRGGVEAFQLQILCDSIESMVAGGHINNRNRDGWPDVTAADLPDFEAVYGAYYERRLSHLPEERRLAARLLIEDGLVRYDPATDTKRRLSVDGDALLASFGKLGLTDKLLEELEKTYLLRREPNTLGGYNYELSHDTLLEPVVAAKKLREAEEAERRRAEEEAEERERLRAVAEAQRIEQEKIRKARQRNIAFSVIALLLLLLAFWQMLEARKQKNLADERSLAATAAERKAFERDSVANEAIRMAELKNKEALTEKERAELATLEAHEQQRKAQDLSVRTVLNLLNDADKEIKALDYAGAYRTLQNAEELGVLRDSVALAMMEIAYYTLESGHEAKAELIVSRIARLLGKPAPGKIRSRAEGRRILKGLNSPEYGKLVERYYPKMILVKGGTFLMEGENETGNYHVQVSDFAMAETETTFWQFALFCESTGRPLKPHKPDWGISGEHPAVKVSWYEACLYANWVSNHAAALRDTVYTLTNRQEGAIEFYSEEYRVDIRDDANGFRLPTEAEWQYAAGGGASNRTEWAGTSNEDSLLYYANTAGSEDGFAYTAPVRNYHPNPLGLYDMSGNTWEWCRDWYGEYDTKLPIAINPRGPYEGLYRVLRGGGWIDGTLFCRSVYRDHDGPSSCGFNFGFRLVLSISLGSG